MFPNLKNPSSKTQRATNVVKATVELQFASVFLDNAMICFKSIEYHQKHENKEFEIDRNAAINLKLSKSSLANDIVKVLEHMTALEKFAVSKRPQNVLNLCNAQKQSQNDNSFLGCVTCEPDLSQKLQG